MCRGSCLIAHQVTGVCVQKLCEAEALVRFGFTNILITNEIVGSAKIKRLVALCRFATS